MSRKPMVTIISDSLKEAKTDAEKVRSSFKRINKIKLSNTASQLFENTILSIAHPPKGMDDKEFIDLLSAYAKMLADMPQEEILKHVKSKRLMQTMLQYRADIEPIAPGSSELALPKPNVGLYKESKKRRIVKRSKK